MLKVSLPQFVTNEECMSCKGCCKYEHTNSSWRPKVSSEQMDPLRYSTNLLSDKIFNKDTLDQNGFIKACHVDGQCQCAFLEASTHTCTVYNNRPFECELYPFLLREKEGKVFLSVHLGCPSVQEKEGSQEFHSYVETLKTQLQEELISDFLNRNRSLAGNYEGYEKEIIDLFEIKLPQQTETNRLFNQRSSLERRLLEIDDRISTQSFANLLAWKDFYSYEIKIVQGAMCIFAYDETGWFLYLPPLAEYITDEMLEECFEILEQKNGKSHISRIEHVAQAQVGYFKDEKYEVIKRGYEYIYLRERIVEYKGNAYKSKRSSYNKFINNYNYSYEQYLPNMADEAMELYESWAQERIQKSDDDMVHAMIEDNYKVHRLLLNQAHQAGLIGRVVKIDGKIKAYTFGFEVSPNMFCVMLEITDLSIKGLASFIFRELCKDRALAKYEKINVMDDSFLNNLKNVKMSFRPSELKPTFSVRRKYEQ